MCRLWQCCLLLEQKTHVFSTYFAFCGLDVSKSTEILEGFWLFCLRAEAVPRPGLDAILVHFDYNSRGFMSFFVFGNFWWLFSTDLERWFRGCVFGSLSDEPCSMYLLRFWPIFERHGYVELFSSKMRNRSDAMPVEVLAFFCCFRVAILRRLEPENTSRLGPNRGPQSARVDQTRAGFVMLLLLD